MRTTLLNPTVWLLAATCAAGVIGAVRGRTARASVEALLRIACGRPVLIVFIGLAAFGLSSRAVLGFLSPGAYAEEVVAARTFLDGREIYASGPATSQVLEDPAAAAALDALPWLSTCQVNAFVNRARFHTDHAHTPMLLLAGVPIVYAGGAKMLYLVLLASSLAAIVIMAGVLIERGGWVWRSPAGLLIVAAVAGWQPVLAGVRQGDAVLPAAGLVTLAWHLISRRRAGRSALPAAAAACLAVPAIGTLPALWRTAPRVAAIATGLFLFIVAATVAVAGSAVVSGFMQTVGETARTYADAPANYALAGRAMNAGAGILALAAILALIVACSWWRGTTSDAAFANFGMVGLLIAPVLWSQHLALILIPMSVLFGRVHRDGSSLALAAFAALALVFSLPDTIAIRIAQVSHSFTLFAISSALVTVWLWTVFSRAATGGVAVRHPAPPSASPVHVP